MKNGLVFAANVFGDQPRNFTFIHPTHLLHLNIFQQRLNPVLLPSTRIKLLKKDA